jgi:prepilin-type N-terminal cleavage/methylation domain-containing protein
MVHPRRQPRPTARPAFTLVELMISIALVAFLILGVNQVFLYTSQAVGAGLAINDAVRSGRAIQQALGTDFAAAVPNGSDANSSAALVITSTAVYAWRDAADLAGDIDANPATYDQDLSGQENASIGPFNYNFRNHRVDAISFFARGHFPRQTAGVVGGATPGPFVASMSSDEAWIWYGLLSLPDNTVATSTVSPNFYGPGSQSPAVNPNNFFSSQFVLGREAVLLRPEEPNASNGNNTPSGYILDNEGTSGQKQYFILPGAFQAAGAPASSFWPLSPKAAAGDGTALGQSRYDLAAGTIPGIQNTLVTALAANTGAAPTWWLAANYNQTFDCDPFVAKPLTPAAMAQASPYFLRGVSQFTVEFAGDFVTQNNDASDAIYNDTTNPTGPQAVQANVVSPHDGTYGDVIADGPDGVVDFFVDKSADTSATTNQPWLWRRQVRWYGLPRDDNVDGQINGFAGTYNNATPASLVQSNNSLRDVVPVRDVVCTTVHPELLPTGYNGETFEHFPDPALTADQKNAATSNPLAKPMANYATAVAPTATPYTNPAAYVAAFGPFDRRVKFIRITITLDDPTGRLRDGQTYQYVFPVGAK